MQSFKLVLYLVSACIGNWKEADEEVQVYPSNVNLKGRLLLAVFWNF